MDSSITDMEVKKIRYAGKIIFYIALGAVGIFALGPFLWLFSTSLKSAGNVFRLEGILDLIPRPLTLDNYIQVWKQIPMMTRFFFNSFIICFFGVFFQVLISALAGYPLARMEFPGKKLIMIILVSTLLLPVEANLVVNFITIRFLQLYNTYAGVLLPGLVSVFGIFLMRQAFLVIPGELDDAARIDGASEWSIWRHVHIPLCAPTIAVLTIFSFVAFWNTFMWPLIILKNESMYPLTVGLSYMANMFSSDFRLVAAGCILAMIPVIILFIFNQRYFVQGIQGLGK
ncbi:MAG: carbohydrate ABC transporter permease [Candidatus Eremiobacteraeota bacterium]|nr:carbohydrate ABC transporter permease [Candidatus Eremiobacteraeota bacterium]